MFLNLRHIRTIFLSLLLFACSKNEEKIDLSMQHDLAALAEFNLVTNQFKHDMLKLHPQWLSRSGNQRLNTELDDRSNAIALRMVNAFNAFKKNVKTRINQKVLAYHTIDKINEYMQEGEVINFLNRYWYFLPFEQIHEEIAPFLVNEHVLETKRDLEAYKLRLIDSKRKLKSLLKAAGIRASKGSLPEKTALQGIIASIDSITAVKAEDTDIYKRLKPLADLSSDELNKYQEDIAYHIENTFYRYLTKYKSTLSELIEKGYKRDVVELAKYAKAKELLELNLLLKDPNYFAVDSANTKVGIRQILIAYLGE